MLADQPESGRERPELLPGLRSFPVGYYLVFYRLSNGVLTIERVLNAARDLSPKSFF
jgi:toxin ParE1/3/4